MTSKLICVPAYLRPAEHLPFDSCKIIAGVTVRRLIGGMRDTVLSAAGIIPIDLGFPPTHGIIIDPELYVTDLKARLSQEGTSLPELPKSKRPWTAADFFVSSGMIAKQAILSLLLAGGIHFVFRGAFDLNYRPTKSQSYTCSGFSNGELYRLSDRMQAAFVGEYRNWTMVNPRQARDVAASIDRYFRGGTWWDDRLSMGIAYYWDAICTPTSHHAFLGLCTALETLVSPGKMEIMHKLAERVAILTESSSERRERVFREVTRLYNIRSRLVHGSVRLRKGRITTASLVVSPRYANVPTTDLGKLNDIVISVLVAVLKNKEFLKIIQKKGSEDTIDKHVKQYFLANLFG